MFKYRIKITIILFLFLAKAVSGQRDSTAIKRCIGSPDVYNSQPVYRTADKMPECKGGMAAFMKYVMRNMNYEGYERLEDRVSSKIYSTFIIDTFGKVRDVCIISRSSELTASEKQMKELIEKMSDWTPGSLNGKKVCVRLIVPIQICVR